MRPIQFRSVIVNPGGEKDRPETAKTLAEALEVGAPPPSVSLAGLADELAGSQGRTFTSLRALYADMRRPEGFDDLVRAFNSPHAVRHEGHRFLVSAVSVRSHSWAVREWKAMVGAFIDAAPPQWSHFLEPVLSEPLRRFFARHLELAIWRFLESDRGGQYPRNWMHGLPEPVSADEFWKAAALVGRAEFVHPHVWHLPAETVGRVAGRWLVLRHNANRTWNLPWVA